jgi:hypothetical protein
MRPAEGRRAPHLLYYPYIGCPVADVHDTFTRSPAWEIGGGESIVLIEGRSGGVSLRHLAPVPEGK